MAHFKSVGGFSLIELMIVVSIIGILSVSALPTYQHYTKRARFAEVITSTEPYKMAVAIALQQGTPLSDINTNSNGIPDSPKSTANLESITVEQGVITATGSNLVDNNTYVLSPSGDGTNFTLTGSCLDTGLCHA